MNKNYRPTLSLQVANSPDHFCFTVSSPLSSLSPGDNHPRHCSGRLNRLHSALFKRDSPLLTNTFAPLHRSRRRCSHRRDPDNSYTPQESAQFHRSLSLSLSLFLVLSFSLSGLSGVRVFASIPHKRTIVVHGSEPKQDNSRLYCRSILCEPRTKPTNFPWVMPLYTSAGTAELP